MEHARAECYDHEEQESDSRVQCPANSRVQSRLAGCAHKGECESNGVEINCLALRKPGAYFSNQRMQADVEPTPYGILGGILPRLQSIPMIKIMRRLPIIEDLVAILDRSIGRRYTIGNKTDVECHVQRKVESRWCWPGLSFRQLGNRRDLRVYEPYCGFERDAPWAATSGTSTALLLEAAILDRSRWNPADLYNSPKTRPCAGRSDAACEGSFYGEPQPPPAHLQEKKSSASREKTRVQTELAAELLCSATSKASFRSRYE